ncbi:glycoside hydrolase family 3 protein [Asticcacaulis endophyticus]|uniref:beta-glucosidase n=1 Tax=Asticcacaulis endophyticus TaxID=1395890 RepID=A0A918UZH6_9CAUL|nr:glycoside hydrolase family 3 protein [Asticcacaulis endophyticus]GGZ45060.1 beta-glucosidase [Asticcacaulis endophyticus]
MLRSFLSVSVCWLALNGFVQVGPAQAGAVQPILDGDAGQWLTVEGAKFRDLNRSGALEPYEDWRLSAQNRTHDLVSRMTLEEKAGAMMHGTAPTLDGDYGTGTLYDLNQAEEFIANLHVNSLLTRLKADPAEFARQNNALQLLAQKTRLGIPVTVSTDSRHHFQVTHGASASGQGFTKWPETLGFAAIGDTELTRRFAEIARREYRAVGIQMALSPQADLSTEPRWPRVNGTFGEDVAMVVAQTHAYVEGFQNGVSGLNNESVIAVAKHWVGYGSPAEKGYDSHNYYGRYAAFPGGDLDKHIAAFKGVFDAGVAGIMPTYSILKDVTLDGKPVEQVGAGFSKVLLTDALRHKQGFTGVVISDFAITEDCNTACKEGSKPGEPFAVTKAWGVDHLSKLDRFALGIEAGLDQFGGTEEVAPVIEAVKSGRITEKRLDDSVYRVMLQKFQIGLFESAIVDPAVAAKWVGVEPYLSEGVAAQSRAMVVLEVKSSILPLRAGQKVYGRNLDQAAIEAAGLIAVSDPKLADVAIVRTSTPYQITHTGYMFGSFQHEGDLDFKVGNEDFQEIQKLAKDVPVIVDVYLDRPAILTNIKPLASALIANFGGSDLALLNALTGKIKAEGSLPFELPSSMEAVDTQFPDRPADSKAPLYKMHYRYGDR